MIDKFDEAMRVGEKRFILGIVLFIIVVLMVVVAYFKWDEYNFNNDNIVPEITVISPYDNSTKWFNVGVENGYYLFFTPYSGSGGQLLQRESTYNTVIMYSTSTPSLVVCKTKKWCPLQNVSYKDSDKKILVVPKWTIFK